MSKEDTCVLYFTEKDVRLSITYVNKKCNILRDFVSICQKRTKTVVKRNKKYNKYVSLNHVTICNCRLR